MREVKLYGSLLFLLLLGALWSYTREDPGAAGGAEKVDVVALTKGELVGLTFYAKTSTVTISTKKDGAGKDYSWFVVDQNKRKRSFVGNDKVEKMLEGFTPFKAVRSLGKLTGAELEQTMLHKPEKKLVLKLRDGERVIEVGGRTSGARDHYVRPVGSQEVFLVASSVLGDLEFPEGRFMQRKLREEQLKDISKARLEANGKTKVALHKNRLAPTDAFWASEAAPEEKSETIENYIDKLDKLSVIEYANDEEKYPAAGTPVLVVAWFGEDEMLPINTTEIWKAEGEDKKAEYYAVSQATRLPVKLSKFAAEQIERDLATVMGD
jgi:hypothetical protein